jgi:hypothetical protein
MGSSPLVDDHWTRDLGTDAFGNIAKRIRLRNAIRELSTFWHQQVTQRADQMGTQMHQAEAFALVRPDQAPSRLIGALPPGGQAIGRHIDDGRECRRLVMIGLSPAEEPLVTLVGKAV